MPIPKEIDFGFTCVEEKLWDLDLPKEEVNVSDLKGNLDIAYLDKAGTDDWNLTLRELIEHPEKHPPHFERVKQVDLSYPIKIYYFQGSWKILDGVHRFCKAVMDRREKILVCKIPPEMIPDII